MEQQRDICFHKDETPKATREDIAYHFSKIWNADISQFI